MSDTDTIIKMAALSKRFGSVAAIDDVSLDIRRGSFTTLLGPSGCGKTTLMRLIAGFYETDHGDIFISGRRINGLPAYRRNTPLVFQDYALFPHMTVAENIGYGLKIKNEAKDKVAAKVEKTMAMLGLSGYGGRYPRQMSGGQQQRVALARALVTDPEILLLDEPLSNLDAKLRVDVRAELRALQRKIGITTIYVTHDQDEALSMSDTIVVMRLGRIEQIGSPKEIYFRPGNRFVADFVGTANFLPATVIDAGGETVRLQGDQGEFLLPERGYGLSRGQQVHILARPEAMTICGGDAAGVNAFGGTIRMSSFLGAKMRYWVQAGGREIVIDDQNPDVAGEVEGPVAVRLDAGKLHILTEAQMGGDNPA